MADDQAGQSAPATAPVPPVPNPEPPAEARPAPPPYRPNMELIGYIEKGQQPPAE
jgi:hypothetical protein